MVIVFSGIVINFIFIATNVEKDSGPIREYRIKSDLTLKMSTLKQQSFKQSNNCLLSDFNKMSIETIKFK